jgi:hypothetical protein
LIRKQWLFLYPVALAVINTLAFLAVYAAADGPLGWSDFFAANFERTTYLHDHFFTDFEFTSALGIAIFAGLAVSLFTALLRAPLFHAIAGPDYPLTPRGWSEALNLFLFYLLCNLALWVAPLAAPAEGNWAVVILAAIWAISILVVFADYVIVFENLGVVAGVRRSLELLRHGWGGVLGVFIVLYTEKDTVFVVLPIAQILLNSIVFLFADLVLIFLYEDLRRRSPGGGARF